MGYDLYAIKPEHWVEYEHDTLSVLHKIKDDWYKDEKYDYTHRIWHTWREGYYDDINYDRQQLPKDLEMFYYYIHDAVSAFDVAQQLAEFIHKNDEYGEIKSFIEWLKHWASKGARFYLSV